MKHSYILILLLIAFILNGCPDNTVNPDPCAGKKPVTAEFEIYEQNYWDGSKTKIKSDTIIEDNVAVFTASNEYDTYQWQIGDDTTIHYTKEFSLRFYEAYGKVPVTLIVTKKPELTCFPNDNGIDTLIKNLYVKPNIKADILGEYFGCNQDAPKDSFTVTIGYYYQKYDKSLRFYINNINKGYNDTIFISYRPNEDYTQIETKLLNKGLVFSADNIVSSQLGLLGPKGIAKLVNNNEIKIEYTMYEDYISFKRIPKVFIGRRII